MTIMFSLGNSMGPVEGMEGNKKPNHEDGWEQDAAFPEKGRLFLPLPREAHGTGTDLARSSDFGIYRFPSHLVRQWLKRLFPVTAAGPPRIVHRVPF
jgi:hypothetical protein